MEFEERSSQELHQRLIVIYGEVFLANPDRRKELEEQIKRIKTILMMRGQKV